MIKEFNISTANKKSTGAGLLIGELRNQNKKSECVNGSGRDVEVTVSIGTEPTWTACSPGEPIDERAAMAWWKFWYSWEREREQRRLWKGGGRGILVREREGAREYKLWMLLTKVPFLSKREHLQLKGVIGKMVKIWHPIKLLLTLLVFKA